MYDAGLLHPLPPPPRSKVVFLLGLVAFPVFLGGLVWPCPLPALVLWAGYRYVPCPLPACGVGPVILLAFPAPPVGGSVFCRGMVWLLLLLRSNVIVTCSLPYYKA